MATRMVTVVGDITTGGGAVITGSAKTDADLRGVSVLGVAMAFALPDLGPVSRACGGRNGGAPAGSRAPTCIAALAPMARSDVLVVRFVALTRQVQLTAGTSAGAAWREQLRNLYWVQYAGSRVLGRQTPPGYAQSVWVDGEIAALQAVLRRAGQPATAPPGWLPADARGRALITTGQPPPSG